MNLLYSSIALAVLAMGVKGLQSVQGMEDSQQQLATATLEELAAEQSACSCVKTFDVLATTGNRRYGQSVGPHNIEVTLRTNEVRSLPLTDMLWLGRTHLWKFHIADFGFTTIRCVSPFDIKKIALVARSTDGWFIESIVTFIADNDGNTLVSSINERLNRWVKHPIDPGFSLNLLFRRAY